MASNETRVRAYFESVLSGEVTACQKIKKLAKRILHDLDNPGRWRFDPEKAMKAVNFVEWFCKTPSGKLGKPLLLEDFQRAFVETIFGFVDEDGLRRYQEALMVIGRKNGKTSLAAALEIYMLMADGEGAPQVYNLATKEEQAVLGFNAASKMVKQSGDIAKHVRKRTKDLYCDFNMGYIKALASNSGSLDGLDVHMAVIDELAAIKDRDLYDLIKQGMSSREQPLLLEITTNGFVRNGIFDAQYDYASRWLDGEVEDERFVAFIYELDDRDEWDDPECWIKANPGLGTIKKYDALAGNVAKAKNDPTFKATVMTKDFNIPENSAVAWLTYEECVNKETFDLKEMGFRYCIVGFDAADTVDLTSAQALMMRPGDERIYELSMYWLPEDVILADMNSGRKERDGVPYQQWISRDLMRTVPGNKVPKAVLLDWLTELRDRYDIYTYAVGFDPWHMDDSTLRDIENFVGKSRTFPVRQGPMTLSQPMKQLKADYKANRIVDNFHPVNSWCRMNVMVKADDNDNLKPVKKALDPRNRIDGFMAELDAYAVLYSVYDDYQAVC